MTLQHYMPTFFQAVGSEEQWAGMREDSQDGAWYAAADVDQRIAQLEAALTESKEVIKVFHDMGVPPHLRDELWNLYQQSPEMKRLNAALQSETASKPVGELTQCDGEDSYE